MHFQLEPKLRNGLKIMKYSSQHPNELLNFDNAFGQGLKLFLFTLVTEVLCIMSASPPVNAILSLPEDRYHRRARLPIELKAP